MAQFDVYRMSRGDGYLLDCQADVLRHFDTRLVVPLLPAGDAPRATRLHPLFTVGDEALVMLAHLPATVPVRSLGEPLASLADEHVTIVNALDMLITGC